MDIFRGAIALAVVIYAVLNRAVNALDVLFALALIVCHNLYSISIIQNQESTFPSLSRQVAELRLDRRQY
jgi:hypothetical protein